jgi:hypothetical protein
MQIEEYREFYSHHPNILYTETTHLKGVATLTISSVETVLSVSPSQYLKSLYRDLSFRNFSAVFIPNKSNFD